MGKKISEQEETRCERKHEDSDVREDDERSPYWRDYDRVFYSSAFRRLGGVTQTINPFEGTAFHNRLTHTMKVARIARTIVQQLENVDEEGHIGKTNKNRRIKKIKLIEQLGGLNADVVAAAALAHDLGHPPFGHIAERQLNSLVGNGGRNEGFEGNAQSFRIVTLLSKKKKKLTGLNLTRATLNAMMKYPWGWKAGKKKWGYYQDQQELFDWVRNGEPDGKRSLEAAIMDWADDTAYAVYDLEDFYRAGLIPVHLFVLSNNKKSKERKRFLKFAYEKINKYSPTKVAKIFDSLIKKDLAVLKEPYRGELGQRGHIREISAKLVTRYVNCVSLDKKREDGLKIPNEMRVQVDLLKSLTEYYVIRTRALQTQDEGKERIIEDLFESFFNAINGKSLILPADFQKTLRKGPRGKRLAADIICSMTDGEAHSMHERLNGIDPGSVLDRIY